VIYFTAKLSMAGHHRSLWGAAEATPVAAGACATNRSSGPTDVRPKFAFHYDRGLSLERCGKYEQAAEAFSKAICNHPFDIDALVHLGLILRELGRDEEANRAFLSALDLGRGTVLPSGRRKGELPFGTSS
jgi:Flp pilus assembly protein TadD